jgi:2Fe-2S ferredoxin
MPPYIILENLHSKSIDCKSKKENLLDIILMETDWMHACGGKGRCTTCKAIFVDGIDSLGDLTKAEQKYASMGKLNFNERLACQVSPKQADLTIRVPESSKLPHINYSE